MPRGIKENYKWFITPTYLAGVVTVVFRAKEVVAGTASI